VRKYFILGGVVLVLVAALLIIWWNPGGKQTAPPTQPVKREEKPKEEPKIEVKNPDTLIIADIGDADTFDPVHAYDNASGEIIFNVYENLIAYDGGHIDRFVPVLATQVPSVENGLIKTESDGTTYITFPIRQGVKFHNGDELTADDVAYSFRRIMIHSHPDSPAWIILEDLLGVHDLNDLAQKVGDEQACQMVKQAVTVDGNNVVFKLPRPSATFLARISQSASWGAITNKEWVIEQGGWNEDCATWRQFYSVEKAKLPLHTKANGTGPFKLERWDPGSEIVLVRNENYWRGAPDCAQKHEAALCTGLAKLARVSIKIIEEFGTRKSMLEQGDADLIVVPRDKSTQVEGLKGVRLVKNLPTISNEAIFFNYDIPVEGNPNIGSGKLDGEGIPPDFFTDLDIRKAFNYSFDWNAYIQQVYLGEATQARSPIPTSLPYFNPESPVYSLDRQKAEEHFKKAWGGQVWEKGFKFTIIYNSGSDTRQVASEIIKNNVEKINPKFKIEVRAEAWPTFLDNFRARRIPLFVIGWLADFPDAHNFVLPYMHSQGSFAIRQSLNKVANYDELIEQAARELDPQKRQELYYELQRRAYEDAIDIFLIDAKGRHWERTWLDGWMYNPMWPGTNFYTLSKKADAQLHPDLLKTFSDLQIQQW